MQTHNFNLVFPLMDWCYGTLHWEAEPAEERAMTRMQHRIEIARGPEATLACAASPALWPEWHPRRCGSTAPRAAGRRALRGGHPRRRPRRALVLDGGRVPAGPPLARQRPWRPRPAPAPELRMPAERGRHPLRAHPGIPLRWLVDAPANLFLLRRRIEARVGGVHAPPTPGRRGADSGGGKRMIGAAGRIAEGHR